MQKISLLALLFICGAGYSWWHFQRDAGDLDFTTQRKAPLTTLTIDRLAPEVQLQSIDGSDFSLSSLKGKVVIVNFWASWCEPCAREFPSFLKLAAQMDGQVELVAISIDARKEDVVHFLKAFDGRRPHLHILWDPKSEVADKYGTDQYPESYILSKTLTLKRKVTGSENWIRPEMVTYLKNLTLNN